MNNDDSKNPNIQKDIPINGIEPDNNKINKYFELGTYQDREPQQSPSTQTTPVIMPSNDTNTTTSNK